MQSYRLSKFKDWTRLLACTAFAAISAVAVSPSAQAQTAGAANAYPYVSDLGNGTYRNPVVQADYSDPDPIRVGDNYYLVASSFNVTPGLPILRSRDLVNWTLVGHALDNNIGARFALPQAGQGVWAPSIREHNGTYYIFFPNYCSPADGGECAEEGIWVVSAPSPEGPWSAPWQLLAQRGVIDPSALWDDDGNAYLIHAYAKSRAGFNSRLDVRPMSVDATTLLGAGQIVLDDPVNLSGLEGPKFYKMNGWYYILAPMGGVTNGWQMAFRSRSVYGPYEGKRVLERGSTAINGPHQGGMVDTPSGQWWFLHFQDQGIYGRVLHLNPITWTDEWPLMGKTSATGIQEPVSTYAKPDLPVQPVMIPQTSDEFNSATLDPQWQWNANHIDNWAALVLSPGTLRLYPQNIPSGLFENTPNLLLQKVPARSFNVEALVSLSGTQGKSRSGLIVMGDKHAALAVEETSTNLKISLIINNVVAESATMAKGSVRLRISFADGGACRFSYAPATGAYKAFTKSFQATKAKWISTRVGLFSVAKNVTSPPGYAKFGHMRFSPRVFP